MAFFRKTTICVSLALGLIASVQARDGDLDRSFNTFGMRNFQPNKLALPLGSQMDLAILPDGKMLLGLDVADNQNAPADFGVMRLNADGSADPSFGSEGLTRVAFDRPFTNKQDNFSAFAVQGDGKILLGGTIGGELASGDDMAIVRLDANGKLDPSYGTAGSAILPFDLSAEGDRNDTLHSLSLQPDGNLLAAGWASTTNNNFAMAIARMTTGGIRDTSFDVDGRVTISFGDYAAAAQTRMLADGQHILVAGVANASPGSTNYDFAVARLTKQGALDPQFGVGGKVTIPFDIAGSMQDIAMDFVELEDGRLLVCGSVQVTSNSDDLGCVRLLANGSMDPSYPKLLVPVDLGGDQSDNLVRMQRDGQGRILLLAAADSAPSQDGSNRDIAVVRLTPDGEIDTSFGKQARVAVPSFPKEVLPDLANASKALTVRPNGSIVVAAQIDSPSQSLHNVQLVRLIGDTLFTDGYEKND